MAFKVPDLIAEGSCEVFAALINETLHEKSGSALTGLPGASEVRLQPAEPYVQLPKLSFCCGHLYDDIISCTKLSHR